MLVPILRVSAAGLMLAFVAILLPTDWMAVTHERLGMGVFPRTPLVDYLTRSIAALYGIHGVFVWIISTDPARYRVFVWFAAAINVAFGAAMIGIDLHAGMPTLWTAIEGPFIMLIGVAIAVAALSGGMRSTP